MGKIAVQGPAKSIIFLNFEPKDFIDESLRVIGKEFSTVVVHSDELSDDRFALLKSSASAVVVCMNDHGEWGTLSVAALKKSFDGIPFIVLASSPTQANSIFGRGNYFYLEKSSLSSCLLLDTLRTVVSFPQKPSKKIEEVLNQNEMGLKEFMSSHPDGMMILNRLGMVLYANRAACHILGTPESKLVERYFQIPASFEHLQKITIPREGLPPIPLTIRKTRLRWQNQVAYWVTFQDVSSFYNKLSVLETEKKRAEERSLSKTMMISNMSHEIRTPLTSIMGYTDLLMQGSLTEEEAAQALANVRANGESLLRIVNDILDIEKVEAGEVSLSMSVVELVEFFKSVEEQAKSIQSEPQVHFKLRMDPSDNLRIETDVVRLKQILLNLISNAFKFTRHGCVELSYGLQDLSDGLKILKCWVKDSGCGIPQDKWEEVFTPFVQLGGEHVESSRGSGLGLPLARNLARKLGGDLRIKSSSNEEGSVFELTVKINTHQILDHGPSPKKLDPQSSKAFEFAEIKGLRILLVDDCTDILNLYSFQLRRMGAVVNCLSSGQEVFSALDENEFDVVLMDLRLGDSEGVDIAKTLRNKGYRKPILAFSADAISLNSRGYKDYSSFNGCLTKPIAINPLSDAICEAYSKYLHENSMNH